MKSRWPPSKVRQTNRRFQPLPLCAFDHIVEGDIEPPLSDRQNDALKKVRGNLVF